MLRVWIATILNFFLPGAGYMINGRRWALGIGFLMGAVGLTFVEQSLQPLDITLYWTMFAAVFIMNTAFAIDAFREGKELMIARKEGRWAPGCVKA
jgi:hypothetical protein